MGHGIARGVALPVGSPRPVPRNLGGWGRAPFWARRVGYGLAAFVVADVVLGCTVFSEAILGILWYFAYGWRGLVDLYAAHGLAFGTPGQFADATALLFAIPPLMALVAYLGLRAWEVPRRLWRTPIRGRPVPR